MLKSELHCCCFKIDHTAARPAMFIRRASVCLHFQHYESGEMFREAFKTFAYLSVRKQCIIV